MHIEFHQSIIDLLNEKQEISKIINNIALKQCIMKFTIFFISEIFIYINLFSNVFSISIYQNLRTLFLISVLFAYFYIFMKSKEKQKMTNAFLIH